MKLIFDSEDCVVGIAFGALLLALSEKWFKLPFAKEALLGVSAVFAIVIVLDILHEFANFGRHFVFVASSLLHNLFDLLLIALLFGSALGVALPVVGPLAPALADKEILFWLGLFEIVSHIIWLAIAPFNT